MDVGAWLRGLGLSQYEQALRDNDVDADLLVRLTAEDLKRIGVASIGHQRRYLRFGQVIPFARLERLLSDLFGLAISEGALANMLKDSAPAFEAQASAIRRRLLAGTVLQSDETSMRVGRRTFWVWVFHHGDSACFVIRPLRGKAVVAAFLGDVRPAFWVSDRLGAQSAGRPRSTRSVSPTCCATSSTPSTLETMPWRPGSWPC